MKPKVKALIEIVAIGLVFIILTYLVQSNIGFFEGLIGKSILGILIYLLIIIIAIVVAPISSIPLMPLVANIWGWKLAAAISIIGWTLGATLAFLIARKYGVKIVKRLVPLKQIHYIESKVPEKNLFLAVVFLRMIIPVDILSYALGLFSKIRFWPYVIATFIGVIPATLILAYVGTINPLFQLIVFLIAGIVLLVGWIVKERRGKKN